VAALTAAGYRTFEEIINLEREELAAVAGIDAVSVDVLMRMIDELTVEVDEEWDDVAGEYVESASEPAAIEAAAEEPEVDAGTGGSPEEVEDEAAGEESGDSEEADGTERTPD
jgi:hypothetical protein